MIPKMLAGTCSLLLLASALGASADRLPFQRIRCFSCTSINATQIVGGAGVDPGVFLSTIRLSAIPITRRCKDDFAPNTAVRAGASTPICDDGLCVKINYSDKLSGTTDVLRACLPESQGVFKQRCSSFSSSQATGTWCVCGDELCNTAHHSTLSITVLTIPVLAYFFRHLLC